MGLTVPQTENTPNHTPKSNPIQEAPAIKENPFTEWDNTESWEEIADGNISQETPNELINLAVDKAGVYPDETGYALALIRDTQSLPQIEQSFTQDNDPIQAIMIDQNIDRATATRIAEIGVIAPNIPVTDYLDAENGKDLLKYTEGSVEEAKALSLANRMLTEQPEMMKRLAQSGSFVLKTATEDMLTGSMNWNNIYDLTEERYAGFWRGTWHHAKVGIGSMARGAANTAWAAMDGIAHSEEKYIEELNNGKLTLEAREEDNIKRQHIAELDAKIGQLRLQLEDYPENKQILQDIAGLEKAKAENTEFLENRIREEHAGRVQRAIANAQAFQTATAEVRSWIDNNPLMNRTAFRDASFYQKIITAIPQVLGQAVLYGSGLGGAALASVAVTSFGNSYEKLRRFNVDPLSAFLGAAGRAAVEAGGEALTMKLWGNITKAFNGIAKATRDAGAVSSSLLDGGKAIALNSAKEGLTEGGQNAVGTGIEALTLSLTEKMSPDNLKQMLYEEGLIDSLEEAAIAPFLFIPTAISISGSAINEAVNAHKNAQNLIKTKEEIDKTGLSPQAKETVVRNMSPEQNQENTDHTYPAENIKVNDKLEVDGIDMTLAEYRADIINDPEKLERYVRMFEQNADTLEFYKNNSGMIDDVIEHKFNEQLKAQQKEGLEYRLDEQETEETKVAIQASVMEEIKIDAEAMSLLLDQHYAAAPAARASMLKSLGITEEELAMQAKNGDFVNTTVSKAVAHAGKVFWNDLTPHTKGFNQKMTLREAEGIRNIAEALTDAARQNKTLLDEQEQAKIEYENYTLLKTVFPDGTPTKEVRALSQILTKVMSSLHRNISESVRDDIISLVRNNFGVRSTLKGDIHFIRTKVEKVAENPNTLKGSENLAVNQESSIETNTEANTPPELEAIKDAISVLNISDEQLNSIGTMIKDTVSHLSSEYNLSDDLGINSQTWGRVWEYITRAVEKFNPELGTLEAYLNQTVKGAVQDEFKAVNGIRKNSSENIQLNEEVIADTSNTQEEKNKAILDATLEILSAIPRYAQHKEILELSRNTTEDGKKLTQKEIGKKLGIHQSTVGRKLKEIGKIPEVIAAEKKVLGDTAEFNQAAMWNFKGERAEFVNKVLDGDLQSKAYIELGSNYKFAPGINIQLPSDIVRHVEKSHPDTREIWNDIDGILGNVEHIEYGGTARLDGEPYLLTGKFDDKTFGVIIELMRSGKAFITSAFYDHPNSIESWLNNQIKKSEGRSAPSQKGQARNGYRVSSITSDKSSIQYDTDSVNDFNKADDNWIAKLTVDNSTLTNIITITKEGSISDFAHEIAHFYLNMMEQLEKSGELNEEGTAQLQAIKDIFADENGNFKTGEHDGHEDFARMFEGYLAEGKAPAPELEGAMQAFRKFALDVFSYIKHILGIDSISPEIREVFDKMLVTNEEIEAHRKASDFARETGASLAEAKRIVFGDDIALKAQKKRREQELKREERTYKRVLRRFDKNGGYKPAERAARKTVEDEPLYAATKRIITAGGINYSELSALLDSDTITLLNNKFAKQGAVIDNGIDPNDQILESIAEEHGYNDIFELLYDMIQRPTKEEAFNRLYAENKELVNQRFRAELNESGMLSDTGNVYDEISDNIFGFDAYQEAIREELKTGKAKAKPHTEGEKKAAAEKAAASRTRAKRIRQEKERRVREELSREEVKDSINHKAAQRESNRLVKQIDTNITKINNKLATVRKSEQAQENQKQEIIKLLDEVQSMLDDHAYYQLKTKMSLEIEKQFKAATKALSFRKLVKALKDTNEDFAKAIVDIVETYKLPAAISGKRKTSRLRNSQHIQKGELNDSVMMLPADIALPENATQKAVFHEQASEVMPAWMKSKQRRFKGDEPIEKGETAAESAAAAQTDAIPVSNADKSYLNMTWGDFIEVCNVIEQYKAMGTEKLDSIKSAEVQTKKDAIKILKESIAYRKDVNKRHSVHEDKGGKYANAAAGAWTNAKNRFSRMDSIMSFATMGDYRHRYMGDFFYENIYKKFRKAAAEFGVRQRDMQIQADALLRILRKEIAEKGNAGIDLGHIVPPKEYQEAFGGRYGKQYTMSNIIAMCLNMGTSGNLYSLVEGMGLGAKEYEAWVASLDKTKINAMSEQEMLEARFRFAEKDIETITTKLSEEALYAIQGILDLSGSMYEEYNEAAYAMNHRSLEKVEGREIAVKASNGKTVILKGYYTNRLDSNTRKTRGKSNDSKSKTLTEYGEALETRRDSLFGRTQKMNPGSMKSRMKSIKDGIPVNPNLPLLDLAVFPQHIDDTLRVITHGKLYNDTYKLYTDHEFKKVFEQKFGQTAYRDLLNWLYEQGNPDSNLYKGNHGLRKAVKKARNMLTLSALGFNVSVAPKQLYSLPSGINEMNMTGQILGLSRADGYRAYANGVALLARGIGRSPDGKLGNSAIRFMMNASPVLKNRDAGAYHLHMSDMKNGNIGNYQFRIRGRKLSSEYFSELAFIPIHAADRAAVMPLWLAAFSQYMRSQGIPLTSNLNEMLDPNFEHAPIVKKAITHADDVIINSQPTTLSTDKAPIQVDEYGKLLSVFMTYTLRAFNKTAYHLDQKLYGRESWKDLLQTFTEMYFIPAMAATLLGDYLFARVLDGEDDEDFWLELAKNVGWETANQMMCVVPIIGSAIKFNEKKPGYNRKFISVPAIDFADQKIQQPRSALKKGEGQKTMYHVLDNISLYLGLPLESAVRNTDKLWNLAETGTIKGRQGENKRLQKILKGDE